MLCLTINSKEEEMFTRPKEIRKRKSFIRHSVEHSIQNKLHSPSLLSNSMKATSNTIIENISPDYIIPFGDKIIHKPNDMTRVLYQNIGSLDISTDSHKFGSYA